MKGTYIYYLQADYGEGTALYNGFPAPQFPRVVAQLEERTGKSTICLRLAGAGILYTIWPKKS